MNRERMLSQSLWLSSLLRFFIVTVAAMRMLAIGLGLLIGGQVIAHDQIPGPPQTQPIVIEGGTLHPISGPPQTNGRILFEAGKITAIGSDFRLPAGTVTVDARGQHIYPGMIDCMSDLGLREIGAVEVTLDSRETGTNNPNVRAWKAVNPDSELIPVTRANGVLTALVAPQGSKIRGQAAVMGLDGWTADEMVLKASAGLCVNWEAFESRSEEAKERANQREQRLSELDELLDEALRYGELREADPEHTPTNARLESLLAVAKGELPVLAEADRQQTIESAVLYAVQRGLKIVIVGGYDADRAAELLKKYDVPVIVTATYRLPRYRHDAYDASYTLPARLASLGVRFAICGETSNSSNARNLPYHAANAVAYGLGEDLAERSVTLSAAEILGVADRIGSLEIGKDATLVIASGSILESDTRILAAYIAGRQVDLTSRHTMLYDKYQKKYQQRAMESKLAR